MAADTGKVVQVLGNVVDIQCTPQTLPKINDALVVNVNEDSHASGNGAATAPSGAAAGVELGGTAMATARVDARSAGRTRR